MAGRASVITQILGQDRLVATSDASVCLFVVASYDALTRGRGISYLLNHTCETNWTWGSNRNSPSALSSNGVNTFLCRSFHFFPSFVSVRSPSNCLEMLPSVFAWIKSLSAKVRRMSFRNNLTKNKKPAKRKQNKKEARKKEHPGSN